MSDLMRIYEAMPRPMQEIARDMANAARLAMRDAGFRPANDDRAARFDEACAVFLIACSTHEQCDDLPQPNALKGE
jgi:hypothetical protein